jgi:hypothetical protein
MQGLAVTEGQSIRVDDRRTPLAYMYKAAGREMDDSVVVDAHRSERQLVGTELKAFIADEEAGAFENTRNAGKACHVAGS